MTVDAGFVDPSLELIGDRGSFVLLGRIRSVEHPIEQSRVSAHVRILLQQHDLAPRDDGPAPFVGLDQAREALEKRRLPGAVAADQREPVARADVHVEVAEEPAFALDQPEVFVGKDRRSHAGAL